MTTHGSWLKPREIYPLSIPEARSPKQRCQQARLPPKAPGESLLQPLPVSGGGRRSSARGRVTLISASVITGLPPSMSASVWKFPCSHEGSSPWIRTHPEHPGRPRLDYILIVMS